MKSATHQIARLVYLTVIAATLAGGNSVFASSTSLAYEDATAGSSMKSPEKVSENFGGLAKLAGRSFIDYEYGGLVGRPVVHTFKWMNYGLVLEHKIYFPSGANWRSTYQLSPNSSGLQYAVNGDVRERGLRPDGAGRIHHAGSMWNPGSTVGAGQDGELEMSAGGNIRLVQEVDEKKIVEIRLQYERNKRAESEQFWSNAIAGVRAVSQAYDLAKTEMSMQGAARAAPEAYVEQGPRRSQEAHHRRVHASGAPNQALPDQHSQSLEAVNAEIQGLERQRLTQEQQYRASSAQSSARQELAAKTPPAIRRRAYLEAVTVCTKPSGPKQSFECRSPLNMQRGHAEDISGHRTPEELASGEACPDMRRLASSTHLVWGCGFAATGADNARDRSAGVDIQGRRTFYCTEGQYSCKRTEP